MRLAPQEQNKRTSATLVDVMIHITKTSPQCIVQEVLPVFNVIFRCADNLLATHDDTDFNGFDTLFSRKLCLGKWRDILSALTDATSLEFDEDDEKAVQRSLHFAWSVSDELISLGMIVG